MNEALTDLVGDVFGPRATGLRIILDRGEADRSTDQPIDGRLHARLKPEPGVMLGARVNEVTQMLNSMGAMGQGDSRSAQELLPLVYDELRRLAAHKLAGEPSGQTLQPTALVHEAWLRLVDQRNATWRNRDHFLAVAAEAMRRVLVDNARRKLSRKHGGGSVRVDLAHLEVAVVEDDATVVAVSEALDRLAAEDPQCTELIKLRFFVGLPNVEAARVLGMAERTAKRTWAYARARLYQELKKAM